MSEEKTNEVSKNDAVDYTKTLGRDGSYLELDMESFGETLMKIIGEGKEWPKQIVLKAGRFDITDPNMITALKNSFEWFCKKEDFKDLSPYQIGFLFFQNVFDSGLRYMIRENQKPMIKYGETIKD
ncbi:MAG: hypothetical protein M0R32_11340 [Candidatus Cloacimonetes bacterium]|jgi:hypothetical protein|nr:hypothetical protein [Candidatus Cloacimonadota bacterium]